MKSTKYKNSKDSQDFISQLLEQNGYTHINLYFDGLNHFIRNFASGYGTLQDATGKDVSGLYYSINSLISIIKLFIQKNIHRNDISVHMVIEHNRSKKMQSIYPEYKQNRKTPLAITLDEVEKNEMFKYNLEEFVAFCELLSKDILTYHMHGVEGDFIIAYLLYNNRAKRTSNDKVLDVIISTDRDFYQLLKLTDLVIFNPNTYKMITKDNFKDVLSIKYNVDVNSFLLYKLLIGDPSDNIKGFTGPVNASKAISFLNSLTQSSITNLSDLYYMANEFITSPSSKISKTQYTLFNNIVNNYDYLQKVFKIIDLSYDNVLDMLQPIDVLSMNKIYENNSTINDSRGRDLSYFFAKHNFDSSFLLEAERYLFTKS